MTNEREPFRIRFWPAYSFVLLWGLGILILSIVAFNGTETEIKGLLYATVVAALVAVPATALEVWAHPVCLSPTEIRSINVLGFNASVPWSEVERVSTLNLGLRFWMVKSKDGVRIFIPTFLAVPTAFRERVQSLGGADHPLSRAVRAELAE